MQLEHVDMTERKRFFALKRKPRIRDNYNNSDDYIPIFPTLRQSLTRKYFYNKFSNVQGKQFFSSTSNGSYPIFKLTVAEN